MIPFHAIVHVVVPSVSGQAVLTMPILVPLSDLLGISRQVTVLAYQTGAGLTELLTPTNGGLMAVLLAAGVPFSRWITFRGRRRAAGAVVGVVGIVAAMGLYGRAALGTARRSYRGAFDRLIRFANWRYAPGTPAGSWRNHEYAV